MVAITNSAHGGVGQAYRLGPPGQTFSQPVGLTFRLTDQDVASSPLAFVDVGWQDSEGKWRALKQVTRDPATRTVAAQVSHFTDFSALAGYQLRPGSAQVRTGQTVDLEVVFCERGELPTGDGDESLAQLVAECGPVDSAIYEVRDWAVNSTVGGNAAVGTITGTSAGATYTAPNSVPLSNPVMVSVEPLVGVGGMRTLLTSSIQVVANETWTGTIDYQQRTTGGDTVTTLNVHSSLTLTLNPETEVFEPTGHVFVSQVGIVDGVDGCKTSLSGQVDVGRSAGTLSILDLGLVQYQGFGMVDVNLNGTSNCNSSRTLETTSGTVNVQFLGISGQGLGADGRTIAGEQTSGGGSDFTKLTWHLVKAP